MPQPSPDRPHPPLTFRRKVVRKVLPARFHARVEAVSWRDMALAVGPVLLLIVGLVAGAIWWLNPAPPKTVAISTGPEGSAFHRHAMKYRDILARDGIRLVVQESEGSLENLARLRAGEADIGFVIDGVSPEAERQGLVSLGSVSHQPVFVFYRGEQVLTRLAELEHKKISIGRIGSGARVLATAMFKAHGIEQGRNAQLRGLEAGDAVDALMAGEIDAVLLMGDSAPLEITRKLMRAPEVKLMSFAQADALVRRMGALNKLALPMGAIDMARNIPPADVSLVAPNVALVARESLHPALSDLLIEAAREVHGRRGLLQDAGAFPAARSSDFALSEDAARYYQYGKGFFYRHLPFWLASLLDRIVIVLLPLAVLLIPALRLLPWLYRWRIQARIYPWYGALISLERGLRDEAAQDTAALLARLDEIEQGVNALKVPLAFLDQIYVLREHVAFVRSRLASNATQKTGTEPA